LKGDDMTHDKPLRDDQMTRLMDRAMLPVTATEDLVAGGLSRGRRATRRRRAAQGVGIGAAAALATVAAVAAPSLLTGQDEQRPSASSSSVDDASSAAAGSTRAPASQSAPDELPSHLQRAQKLLVSALPDDIPDPGYVARVDYDPDGRGAGEILEMVTVDNAGSKIVARQDARCDRVAASPSPDDCVDSGDGWVFTGPSVPDISGKDPGLAGVEANYILRNGRTVNLIAYNALKPLTGAAPTRPAPVLDAAELVELVTKTDWFA
jgi:hypothetical protein